MIRKKKSAKSRKNSDDFVISKKLAYAIILFFFLSIVLVSMNSYVSTTTDTPEGVQAAPKLYEGGSFNWDINNILGNFMEGTLDTSLIKLLFFGLLVMIFYYAIDIVGLFTPVRNFVVSMIVAFISMAGITATQIQAAILGSWALGLTFMYVMPFVALFILDLAYSYKIGQFIQKNTQYFNRNGLPKKDALAMWLFRGVWVVYGIVLLVLMKSEGYYPAIFASGTPSTLGGYFQLSTYNPLMALAFLVPAVLAILIGIYHQKIVFWMMKRYVKDLVQAKAFKDFSDLVLGNPNP